MSIEAYEEIIKTAWTDAAINEAEKEYASEGFLLDAREALLSLRRKQLRCKTLCLRIPELARCKPNHEKKV